MLADLSTDFLVGQDMRVFLVEDVIDELQFIERALAAPGGVARKIKRRPEWDARVLSFIEDLPDEPGQPPLSVLKVAVELWSIAERQQLAAEVRRLRLQLAKDQRRTPEGSLAPIRTLLCDRSYRVRMWGLIYSYVAHPVWTQQRSV